MWSTHSCRMTKYKVKIEEGMEGKDSWSELRLLPIGTCKFWFNALAHDDVDKVEATLGTAETREKRALLNGYFDFNDSHFAKYNNGKWFHLQLPFSIAVTCASFKVIASLVKHGADPCQEDTNGNNCIHSLIVGAFYMPESEPILVGVYKRVSTMFTEDQMLTLLKSENQDGLRPLEFASQQGTALLLNVILQTKGVYITKEETKGLVSYQWLDITEYESYGKGNRRAKSPLLGLMYLEKSKLNDPSTKAVMTSPLIQRWVKAKVKCNILPLFAWFLIRLIHIVTFFVFQADVSILEVDATTSGFGFKHNSTMVKLCASYESFSLSHSQRMSMMIYLIIHSACIILFDVCHIIRKLFCCPPLYSTNLKGLKKWAVHYSFYRTCQFLTGVLIGVGIVLAIARSKTGDDVSSYLQIASCVVSVWSMLYFVQLLPSIGHFVIVVQHMLRDLLHFIIIFIMMLTPFVQVLFVLINKNSKTGCLGDFNNYMTSFYTTFKMMLNMVDLSEYVDRQIAFSFLHIMYVFVVAILLINFLIALMSNSVSEVAECKDIIMVIQRLSVAWTLELRMGWILAPFYSRLQRRSFDWENGKIYLVRVFFDYIEPTLNQPIAEGERATSTLDIPVEDMHMFHEGIVTKYIF